MNAQFPVEVAKRLELDYARVVTTARVHWRSLYHVTTKSVQNGLTGRNLALVQWPVEEEVNPEIDNAKEERKASTVSELKMIAKIASWKPVRRGLSGQITQNVQLHAVVESWKEQDGAEMGKVKMTAMEKVSKKKPVASKAVQHGQNGPISELVQLAVGEVLRQQIEFVKEGNLELIAKVN